MTIEEPTKEIQAGSRYQMSATILPVDATIKDLKWCSSNETVATIDENTGILTGISAGEVTITAVAEDYCDVSGSLEIEIVPRVVGESVTLNRTSVTLCPGETPQLTAEVLPVNTLYKTVTWSSYPGYVASVSQEGLITAIVAGTTTITASTADGISATCVVTVDTRKKVKILKTVYEVDGETNEYYDMYFNQGTIDEMIWKMIGCDLSIEENRSGQPLWIDQENLNEDERRYLHNCSQQFQEDQLAFIYQFDPYGVEYYVRMLRDHREGSVRDRIDFKDTLFKKIFGENLLGYFSIENDTIVTLESYYNYI